MMSSKTQACLMGNLSLLAALGSLREVNKFVKAHQYGSTFDQVVAAGGVVVGIVVSVSLGTLSWKAAKESSECHNFRCD